MIVFQHTVTIDMALFTGCQAAVSAPNIFIYILYNDCHFFFISAIRTTYSPNYRLKRTTNFHIALEYLTLFDSA